MDRSERKAAYHLLGLIGALMMGALLVVVVLMGPMGAAQANQQRAHANKVEQNKNKTVQVTAAGENNHRVRGDENPMVYKSVDSRPGFAGGLYIHVVECPKGYKATGGGFDLNTPSARRGDYWKILSSHPGEGSVVREGSYGDAWVVAATGHTAIGNKKLPTFTAYAACAPKELLSGLKYRYRTTNTIGRGETKTFRETCARDERVIGGGFAFGREPSLVRSERSREDELLSWESGVTLARTADNDSWPVWTWAVCVSRDALEDTQYLEATDTSTTRAVANTPSCPQGTYLLSGGAGVPDDAYGGRSNPWWSNSSPPNEGAQSWKASVVQAGETSIKVHAFALCGRFADGGGGQGAGGGSGGGGGDGGGDDGRAFAQLGLVIQCDDELPCDATADSDVLSERAGDGAKDRMIAQGGYDILRAQNHTNDRDVANGGAEHDVLLVNDGDARDGAIGGEGTDVCVVDAAIEAADSCEAVIYR